MTLRRLLVLPLLSPLLAVLVLAALNPSPQLSFRLLTWSTPRAPLGLWLGGGAVGGAALSGVATALAIRQGQAAGVRGRRRVTAPFSRTWAPTRSQGDGGWEDDFAEEPTPSRRGAFSREPRGATSFGDSGGGQPWREPPVAVAPPRSPGEPAPTMDVPFRVLYRPTSSQQERAPAASSWGQARPAREREPVPVGGEDDWGQQTPGEDW